MKYLEKIGLNAKRAFQELKSVNDKKVRLVLNNFNNLILKNKRNIIRENMKDVRNSKRKNLIDRLVLNEKRIDGIRHSIDEISRFNNPIGKVLEKWQRPNKLKING